MLQPGLVADELLDSLPEIIWLKILLERVQSLHVEAPHCLLNLSGDSQNICWLFRVPLRRKMVKLLVDGHETVQLLVEHVLHVRGGGGQVLLMQALVAESVHLALIWAECTILLALRMR